MCRWLVEAYMENTTGLASMMAYDLLALAVAPGLFLLSVALSLFGTDPTLLHHIIQLVEGFLPEMSHEIIERQVVALVITGSTSRVALLGIPLALYLGVNLINTVSRTLNHMPGHPGPETLVVEPLDHRPGAAVLVRGDDPFQRQRHRLRRARRRW